MLRLYIVRRVRENSVPQLCENIAEGLLNDVGI
jgi:hypothetical protein